MAMKPIDLTGGKSVYCFNEAQIKSAHQLAFDDPVSGPRIRMEMEKLEQSFTRNERAALAFVLIDRLLQTPADS